MTKPPPSRPPTTAPPPHGEPSAPAAVRFTPLPRSALVTRVVLLGAVAAALGLMGYEWLAGKGADLQAWTPPAGLTRADTPDWLQVLCADRTPELCAAADTARRAEDCVPMRAALDRLFKLEKQLTTRGVLAPRQHWVLVELYDQGRDLCQFETVE